jgi:hypothetical protein
MSNQQLSIDDAASEIKPDSDRDAATAVSGNNSDNTSATSLNAKKLELYYAKAGFAEWGC